jgi:hypothetical protein
MSSMDTLGPSKILRCLNLSTMGHSAHPDGSLGGGLSGSSSMMADLALFVLRPMSRKHHEVRSCLSGCIGSRNTD